LIAVARTTAQIIFETLDDKGRTVREALVIEVEDSPRPEGTVSEIDLVLFQLRAVSLDEGEYGVYGMGEGLQTAVERPWQCFGDEDMFPDLFSKAAALAESIVQGHTLVDASKRTAVMSVSYLFDQFGYRLAASKESTEQAILDLTLHNTTRENYAQWLQAHAKPKRLPPTRKQLLNQHLLEMGWINNPYRGQRCWRDPLTGEWKTANGALTAQSQRVFNPLSKLSYWLLRRSLFKS
jgi:death-on-curing protein